MAGKQKLRPLVKIDPAAFSIRSDAMSCITVLFDESNLKKFNKAEFDLAGVALRKDPKKQYDKLRRWAGRGTWMAVASHPEILDSDGVPNLDILFQNRKTKEVVPPTGHWFDPVQQLIDLSSGQFRVVYEDQFFCEGFDQAEGVCQIESPNDGVPTSAGFSESCSYLIKCKPGWYHANVFTRFIDSMVDDEIEGAADLAIILTPTTKPDSFRMSVPLLPIHPPTQDITELRRTARGLSAKPTQTVPKPKLLKSGEVQTGVTQTLVAMALQFPKAIAKKFGFEPGLLLTLEIEGKSIRGVAVENATPDPSDATSQFGSTKE